MIFYHIILIIGSSMLVDGIREYKNKDMIAFREEIHSMFDHAYSSYLTHAYPYDELRSLSCDGFDTWGSFSLTLIDALDTLAVMGNFSEFRRVVKIISTRENFESNINVSVFETNIRVVGGLLSAHLLSHKAGIDLEPGWPCNGPLLRLAEDMAKRLIAAFDTPTGMPYGTVNLKYGIPEGETSITCTACIGTFILEFGTLSRLTGDPLYEEVAMNAIKALHFYRSNIGLVGNHIDVLTGRWTAQDSGIGAGVDSYFEYLAKGTLLFQNPLLASMFQEHKAAIEKYIKKQDWYVWVSMTKGQLTLPVFQSLDAYWPGVLSLFGEIDDAMRSLHNYHKVWKQFGFTPEFYNIPQGEVGTNREGYPLRPELIESVMYLYRTTKDPYLLQVGEDILRSLQHSAKTNCGYATINDVRDHSKADRMESFFLAETTKYLYLLFDPENFIHDSGQRGDIIQTQQGQCIINAGGYIFNTEAHPIDPGALQCCQKMKNLFPNKKSTLRTFVPVKHHQIGNNYQDYDLFQNKQPNNNNETQQAVEIIKLSEMRQSSNKDSQLNDYEIPNPDSSKQEENEESNKNETISSILDTSDMQIIAPPNLMYKADDSDNTENFETSSLSEGDYATSSIDNDTTTTIKPEHKIKTKFDPQILLEKIRRNNYPTNTTAKFDYQTLYCQPQPFLQRISIMGEFF